MEIDELKKQYEEQLRLMERKHLNQKKQWLLIRDELEIEIERLKGLVDLVD